MEPRILTFLSILVIADASRACADVVINEVLPAPGSDWSSNGSFNSTEDEWIELVNTGASPVDLADYFLSDGAAVPRCGFDGALNPGEHLFVTGEHAVDWEALNGFPALGLSLNNSGDVVYLFRTVGGVPAIVDSLAYTGSDARSDVSIGRLPDGTGVFRPFDALTPSGVGPQPTPGGENGGPAAPKILSFELEPSFPTSANAITVRAVCADAGGISTTSVFLNRDAAGTDTLAMSLTEGAATYGTWELEIEPMPAGTRLGIRVQTSDGTLVSSTNEEGIIVASADSPVVLNEILADPPADLAGDANGDGIRGTADDEFVEILNRGTEAIDLSGWSLRDATGLRHEFTSGLVLGAGAYFVVFGGGTPTGIPGGSTVASTGGLSLNNTADEVQLIGPDGVASDVHTYGSEGNGDQSLIRVPDGYGDWMRPIDLGYGWRFSPGVSNAAPTAVSETSWTKIKSLYHD
jgi:hypothetical protein